MRAMLAVLFCALSVVVSMSAAHPLTEEEGIELLKRYFDPIRFAVHRPDEKREDFLASKRYIDPILCKHAL